MTLDGPKDGVEALTRLELRGQTSRSMTANLLHCLPADDVRAVRVDERRERQTVAPRPRKVDDVDGLVALRLAAAPEQQAVLGLGALFAVQRQLVAA